MKKITIKFKQVMLIALGLITVGITIPNANASVSSDEEEGESGSGWFQKEHYLTVHCTATTFSNTTFYNERGEIVGTTIIQNGVITSQYHGSYSRYTITTGGVEAHYATAVECYGWGWGCTPVSSAEACS